ncbi:hypothetical protein ACFV2X_26755 [Streptomyces sp. NPDC059679]|uniref:hypothetical protein n=1 Tax=Streptomyces sp. NPDC059679 TaxID=3346903 RepID=UPI00369EFF1C
MADSSDNQKHVKIALTSVYCRDTEDITGADEFYVAGGAGTGPRSGSKSKAILTKPAEINSRQKKILSGDEYVIFDDNVYVDDFVEIGLEFCDKDFNEDDFDAKYVALVSALTGAIGTAVGSLATPAVGAVAGAILAATPPALIKVLATIDKDDILGTVQKRVNVADYPDGRSGPFTWKFSDKKPNITEKAEGLAWSDWDYEVDYVIDVGPAT